MNETILKLRIWARAEMALAKIHARGTGHRFSLAAIAVGLALLTVGLINVGAYELLAETHGKAKGAFMLGGANALLAILVMLASRRTKPRPEEEMVHEIRQMALTELAADAERLKQEFGRLNGHVQSIESGLASLSNVGASAGMSMISNVGPLVELLVQALKSRHKTES